MPECQTISQSCPRPWARLLVTQGEERGLNGRAAHPNLDAEAED